jgi:hypothetical protein
MKRIISILHICILFSFLSISQIFAQYEIKTNTFGNGIGVMKGTNFTSVSTLGQPAIGNISDNTLILHSGFWFDSQSLTDIYWPDILVPDQYNLFQNYPNPFNSSTNIAFDLPSDADVKLEIYNILGQHILTILDERKEKGHHEIKIDANNLASGIYLYRLQSKEFMAVKKMILAR